MTRREEHIRTVGQRKEGLGRGRDIYGSLRKAELRDTEGRESEGSPQACPLALLLPGIFQDGRILFQTLKYYWIILCGYQMYSALLSYLFTFYNDTYDA